MVESTHFDFGEKKFVVIRVESTNRSSLKVDSATFKIKSGNDVESSGQCVIVKEREDSVLIKALVEPMKPNTRYILTFEYDVFPEHLIYEVIVRVC